MRDATVTAQLLLAGTHCVTRWRGYQLLERPQIQLVLAHAPTVSVTRINSGEVVELFEGGWLELSEGLSRVRVMVARHRAPAPEKHIPVGKRVGEWVYELFITTLGAEGFLIEDVLDLYHGRGAFEAVLADEDIEEDPDRWCSYTECGQELWQIACQWVWNLRLCLGQTMQAGRVREIEWAPPKEAPAFFIAEETPPEEYGPWQWAAAFGRATGRFGAEDARLARGREAVLSCGGQLVVERSASRECLHGSAAVYLAYQTDCLPCALREQCLASGAKGDRARRVSAVRHLLPPPSSVVERQPVVLGPMRLSSMWLGERFAAPGPLIGAGNTSRSFRLRTGRRAFPLPLAHRVPCVRITAGVGKIGLHAMPGRDHPNYASLLLAFPHASPATNTGGTSKPRSFFYAVSFSSEPLMRGKNPCLLLAISFHSFITRLLTSRCASRGMSRIMLGFTRGERKGPYTGGYFETRWSPEAVILRCAQDLLSGTTQILRCAQDDTPSLVPFLKTYPCKPQRSPW